MKSRLGDKVRIQHINDSIREIYSYTKDATFNSFQTNTMMQFAVVKQLEIIGEAANHLSEELKVLHRDIQWSEIIALRNVLIHEYFGIDVKLVWDIVEQDIPDLKIKIEDILKHL
jgi:uncharacterized protein with HEPN domain